MTLYIIIAERWSCLRLRRRGACLPWAMWPASCLAL